MIRGRRFPAAGSNWSIQTGASTGTFPTSSESFMNRKKNGSNLLYSEGSKVSSYFHKPTHPFQVAPLTEAHHVQHVHRLRSAAFTPHHEFYARCSARVVAVATALPVCAECRF